jgi:hypothetical protein
LLIETSAALSQAYPSQYWRPFEEVLERLARHLWLVTGVSGLPKSTPMLDDANRAAEEKEYHL